jgi:hypothetical protein
MLRYGMTIALYKSKSRPRRIAMKELIRMFDNIWISVAFAEAGEQETARKFMGPERFEAESAETCQAI